MRTHAIITPWPMSQGLRTWCGYDGRHEDLKGDLVGATPQAIDCAMCITAMRLASSTLGEWVPQLTSPTLNSERVKAGIRPLPEPGSKTGIIPTPELGSEKLYDPEKNPAGASVARDGEVVDLDTGQVLFEAGEVIPNVIHILDAGMPVCEFTRDLPMDWPPGHRWIGLESHWIGIGADRGVKCEKCVKRADAAKRPVSGNAVTVTEEEMEKERAAGRINDTDLPSVPELDPETLEVMTFRADGNVTSGPNAVKITHRPTGIETISTKHRSKIKNESEALKLLRERVAAHDMDYINELHECGAKTEWFPRIGWCGAVGHDVRGDHCGLVQYRTRSGGQCSLGHGGAPTLDEDPNP